MNKRMLGALAAASVVMAPMAAMAQTEVHFWHAFTGRLGELVKGQVAFTEPWKNLFPSRLQSAVEENGSDQGLEGIL